MIADPQPDATHVYKRVGDLAIEADVYRHAAPPEGPVVVWIHGGALINGTRSYVPEWLINACDESGFVLVSADYRLAPETKLSRDRRGHHRSLPLAARSGTAVVRNGSHADRGRRRIRRGIPDAHGRLPHPPRVNALVSLYGYGDLIGDWYTQPSPHPCHHELHLTEEEALRFVAGPALSDELLREGDGHAFYQLCRQRGSWPREVSGWILRSTRGGSKR